ncbi:polymorphic outer membrane protein, partial [Chlamydia psittaci 09DC77]
GGHSSSC